MKTLFTLLILAGSVLGTTLPKPDKYFNDYASVVTTETSHQLNERLAQYEKDTTNQILVVIYPNLDPDTTLEDVTLDSFRSWGVGQLGKNNGVVLFVFMKSDTGHGRDRIEVGRGLEGALTDSKSKDILDDVLGPRLKAHQYDVGFTDAVSTLMTETKEEISGAGSEPISEPVVRSASIIDVVGTVFLWLFSVLCVMGVLFIAFFSRFMKKKKPEPVTYNPIRSRCTPGPIHYNPVHTVRHPDSDYRPPVIVPVIIPDPVRYDPPSPTYDPPSSTDSGWSSGGGDCGGGGSSSDF